MRRPDLVDLPIPIERKNSIDLFRNTSPPYSITYDSATDLISLENVTSSFISTNSTDLT